MNLSPHFTLAELTRSEVATRKGLVNLPDDRQTSLLRLLCEQVLEPAREVFGVIVPSSGYRSPAVNLAVGGSTNSDHMILAETCAVDLDFNDLARNAALFRWLAVNAPWSKLIWELDSWVHVSFRPGHLYSRRAPWRIAKIGADPLVLSWDDVYDLGRAT